MLELTDGLDEAGGIRWELAGCLLFAWAIVAVVLIRGISSLGKVGQLPHSSDTRFRSAFEPVIGCFQVVYFTALFPYVLLTILLVRGAMLEGSLEGVKFYITPQWKKLADARVSMKSVGSSHFLSSSVF